MTMLQRFNTGYGVAVGGEAGVSDGGGLVAVEVSGVEVWLGTGDVDGGCDAGAVGWLAAAESEGEPVDPTGCAPGSLETVLD